MCINESSIASNCVFATFLCRLGRIISAPLLQVLLMIFLSNEKVFCRQQLNNNFLLSYSPKSPLIKLLLNICNGLISSCLLIRIMKVYSTSVLCSLIKPLTILSCWICFIEEDIQ